MKRTRLHRREQGSNQYASRSRYLGLRGKTWESLAIIASVFGLLLILVLLTKDSVTNIGYLSPLPVHAEEGVDANGLPILTPEEQSDWNAFIRAAHKLAPIYDYPVKVILAQAALESARGTSKYARERKNFFGFTCYDRDPDRYCSYFENQEQGILEYMRLIKNSYPEAYANRANPDRMIELIKAGGYATDPLYVQKIKALPEWKGVSK